MKIIAALFIVVILAFAGYHRSFRKLQAPGFARMLHLTGIEFLLLGLLLGPGALGLLDAPTQRGLAPLSALVLGWVGILFGFQFEISKLRRFPRPMLAAGWITGAVTALCVFCAASWGLPKLFSLPQPMAIICSLALAASACCTGQIRLALTPEAREPHNKETALLLQYMAGADGALALMLFSLAHLHRPEAVQVFHLGGMLPEILICVLGEFLLFLLFLNKRRKEEEVMLVLMGMVILGSGLAAMLSFSPLLTNFLVGVLLVNVSRDKERLYGMLASVEKPAYLLMLVFLGAAWKVDVPLAYLGAAAYFLVRTLGKTMGGFVAVRSHESLAPFPALIGFALLDHGGIALAILLDLHNNFPEGPVAPVVSLALAGVLIHELLAPGFLGKVLKGGDHGP